MLSRSIGIRHTIISKFVLGCNFTSTSSPFDRDGLSKFQKRNLKKAHQRKAKIEKAKEIKDNSKIRKELESISKPQSTDKMEKKKAKLKKSLPTDERPTTRLGMLAWDRKKEIEDHMTAGSWNTESAMGMMANQRIRKAIEQGQFDKLSGEGKPLNKEYFNMPIDMKIMKNAGIAPEWIEEAKDIKKSILAIQTALMNARLEASIVYKRMSKTNNPTLEQLRKTSRWRRAESTARINIQKINKRIRSNNFRTPSITSQMMELDENHEISNVFKNGT